MNRLTIKEAMAATGVCRRTIYNWIQANKVSYVRTAGGSVRIDPDSLWRAGNTETQTSAATTTES